MNPEISNLDRLHSEMSLRFSKQVEKDILDNFKDDEKENLKNELEEIKELIYVVAKKYDVKEVKDYLVRKNMK